jgi:hypothetical protein
MDTYLFSRAYQSSVVNNIDIYPYNWFSTKSDEISGIWINIQDKIYNKDALILQGYRIEKVLRSMYYNNYTEDE